LRLRLRIAAAGLAAATMTGTAVLTTAVYAGPAQAAGPTFTTISKQPAADPGFAKFGSSYYVYATGGSDGILPIFRGSSTTKAFSKVGNAYAKAPTGLVQLWAPHVVARDGKYFMFFTATTIASKPHCVYWAVSASPTSGFGSPHLLVCGNATATEAIDPTVYVTAKGVNYVVWKRGHYNPTFPEGTFQIQARKLTFSGASVAFSKASNPTITLAEVANGTVMEAPSLIAHGGKVWLFVARGRFDDNDYHTDVWVAPGFGPGFTFSNHLMATGQGYGSGPGGAEVITDAGGVVRIAYHVWAQNKPTPSTPGTRIVRVATVTWPGGKPHVA
jgi:hypothetical protein